MKDSTLEVQLQCKNKELAAANEKLEAKDSELQEKITQLKDISECFHRKENEISGVTARLAEISNIKSQLDEANAHVDALGKKCCPIDRVSVKFSRQGVNKIIPTVQFPLLPTNHDKFSITL